MDKRCCYSSGEYKISDIVQLCGEIDELSCVLGVARLNANGGRTAILEIQAKLYVICCELHNGKEGACYKWIHDIDRQRRFYEDRTNLPHDFTISGGIKSSTHLDHARSVARRCERRLIEAFSRGKFKNPRILDWINKVSDLLYLMARYYDKTPIIAKEVVNGTGI